jgi:hypothetical protein
LLQNTYSVEILGFIAQISAKINCATTVGTTLWAKRIAYSRFHPENGNAKKILIIPSILPIKKLKLESIHCERNYVTAEPAEVAENILKFFSQRSRRSLR